MRNNLYFKIDKEGDYYGMKGYAIAMHGGGFEVDLPGIGPVFFLETELIKI